MYADIVELDSHTYICMYYQPTVQGKLLNAGWTHCLQNVLPMSPRQQLQCRESLLSDVHTLDSLKFLHQQGNGLGHHWWRPGQSIHHVGQSPAGLHHLQTAGVNSRQLRGRPEGDCSTSNSCVCVCVCIYPTMSKLCSRDSRVDCVGKGDKCAHYHTEKLIETRCERRWVDK